MQEGYARGYACAMPGQPMAYFYAAAAGVIMSHCRRPKKPLRRDFLERMLESI